MYASHGGSDGEHVKIGIALGKETALQACMYSYDGRVGIEQLSVALDGVLAECAVGIHLPCRIAIAMRDAVSLCQFEDAPDGIGHIGEVAHHA